MIKRTRIVKHKLTGKVGRVQKGHRKAFGKVPVEFEDGTKMLCKTENLETTGYED